MKILVFGANGYIGSHLVRRFVHAGHSVAGVVRSDAAAARLRADGAKAIVGDLAQIRALLPLLDDADVIVYAAQLLLQPEYDSVEAMLGHIEGSNKTFIFTSGTGVFAQRTDGDWSEDSFAEEDTFVPSKYIGARKLTEDFVRDSANHGVRSFVVRPPLVWGHGGCLAIKKFYASAAKTGAVCYVGRGLNLYSTVHVEDLANLYQLVIEKGTPGKLYHAVSGETNFRTIAEGVARVLGVPTRSVSLAEACEIWDTFTALIGHSMCSRSRSPLSRRELGWHPSETWLDIMDEVAHPAFCTSA